MNQGKKKVLYVITKSNWGGAQRYVYDLATNLPRETFETVALAGGTPGTTKPGILIEKLTQSNIRTLYLVELVRDLGFLDWNAFWSIVYAIRAEKPDVLHVNSSKAGGLGALAGRVTGVPNIVFTVHGWPFKQEWHPIQRVWIYLASWLTAILSHRVIVVSKQDETQAKRMWFVARKIRYVPLGIETPQFLSRDESLRVLSLANKETKRIVTIAELTKNKGVKYAIEALARLKKNGMTVSYFIIGDGEERASLQKLAQKLGVSDFVHFLGFIPDASKYLKAFDIFLLPSIKEGMPYILLEAAAAGIPIITTNVVNSDFIDRSKNVHTIPPEDPKKTADMLAETLRTSSSANVPQGSNDFPLLQMLQATIALY